MDLGADWIAPLYDALLADMLLRRDDVAAEIAFLSRRLGLRAGSRVLDQGCGLGSLAVPLAQATGAVVTGIDQSVDYIAEAQAAARRAGVDARFVVADARSWRSDEPCDAAFSWWTSWGHAADDAGNLATLASVRASLMPGGRFVLDTMNVLGVLRGFRPEVTVTRAVPRLGGAVMLVRHSRIDPAAGLLHKEWIYHLPDGAEVRRTSTMRLYLPWEVAAMLRAAGFAAVELIGSMAGEPLEADSPRLLAIATA